MEGAEGEFIFDSWEIDFVGRSPKIAYRIVIIQSRRAEATQFARPLTEWKSVQTYASHSHTHAYEYKLTHA